MDMYVSWPLGGEGNGGGYLQNGTYAVYVTACAQMCGARLYTVRPGRDSNGLLLDATFVRGGTCDEVRRQPDAASVTLFLPFGDETGALELFIEGDDNYGDDGADLSMLLLGKAFRCLFWDADGAFAQLVFLDRWAEVDSALAAKAVAGLGR